MVKRRTKDAIPKGIRGRVIQISRRTGMFVLFEDKAYHGITSECWVWWDSKTGKQLLTYWPEWQKWSGCGKSGECVDWQHALGIAHKNRRER